MAIKVHSDYEILMALQSVHDFMNHLANEHGMKDSDHPKKATARQALDVLNDARNELKLWREWQGIENSQRTDFYTLHVFEDDDE